MDVPLHHLLRQLRDAGMGWREIAVAFPDLGLDPAVDYDALAAAAARHVIRSTARAHQDSPDAAVPAPPAPGFVLPWQLQNAGLKPPTLGVRLRRTTPIRAR
jgi:hypothetical protein